MSDNDPYATIGAQPTSEDVARAATRAAELNPNMGKGEAHQYGNYDAMLVGNNAIDEQRKRENGGW